MVLRKVVLEEIIFIQELQVWTVICQVKIGERS
jgi:hypothetical protein